MRVSLGCLLHRMPRRERLQMLLLSVGTRPVLRNAIILALTIVSVNAISVPFIAFLARALGPEGFGLYSVAVTFASIFAMAIDMGTGKLLTREISKHGHDVPMIIGAQLLPKPFLFVLIYLMGLVGGPLLGYRGAQWSMVLASIVIALFMAHGVAARAVFHAFQRMEYDAIGLLTERVVSVACAVMAVGLGYGVSGVVVGLIIGNMADTLVSWTLASRRFNVAIRRPDRACLMHALRAGFPLATAALFSTLYIRSQVILIERLLGSSAAGWYNAAFQLLVIALFIPQMFSLALFPVLARLAQQDRAELERIGFRVTWLMTGLGGLLSVAAAGMAGWIVPLLYSSAFAASIEILRVLALSLPLTFAHSMLAQVLVASDRQDVVGRATAIAAVASIAASAMVIQCFGVVGAAWAAVLAEALLLGQYLLALRTPKV